MGRRTAAASWISGWDARTRLGLGLCERVTQRRIHVGRSGGDDNTGGGCSDRELRVWWAATGSLSIGILEVFLSTDFYIKCTTWLWVCSGGFRFTDQLGALY